MTTETAPVVPATSAPSSRRPVDRLRGRNNEGVLALIILVLVLVMSLVNGDFFTVSTLFSILRNSLVEMVFALGVLIVIISGGIDVSFPVIGIFAGYTTVVLARSGDFDPGVAGAFVIAVVVGSLLGLINGGLIARFKLPTLIVTLGTQGIFRGVLLAYVGSKYIAELPQSLTGLSTADLITHQNGATTSRLHVFIVPVVLLCLAVHWLLRRTMFGRGVYALGGDSESARRAGFPVVRLQVMIYVLVGLLAGIAGAMHVILSRNANPYELAGTELDIIAAVVLGGASILGGRGSVLGAVLGVVLIALIKNSLILMGVPGTWQRTAVGVLLVVGVSIQALGARRRARRRTVELETAEV
ncbi:MAG: transporter permease [Blastococcus sp.]|jgi:simple sugar transport system permease protein|nr:transporter permease [Blastococcus sp.]